MTDRRPTDEACIRAGTGILDPGASSLAMRAEPRLERWMLLAGQSSGADAAAGDKEGCGARARHPCFGAAAVASGLRCGRAGTMRA